MINHVVCGLHYWGHCNFVLFSHCLNNVSNNPRSKYKHEIARCNFWNSKYMVEIDLRKNNTALVQGQTSRQCSKTSRLRLKVFEHCLEELPLNSSGIVLPSFNFNKILLGKASEYFAQKPLDNAQKPLGCASRFWALSRGFWVHILLASKITSCDFI